MEQQEKKVIADIKKMAKAGQMVSLGLFSLGFFKENNIHSHKITETTDIEKHKQNAGFTCMLSNIKSGNFA